MISPQDRGRIGEQNEAYRKGLVLGLTMAEVGILIIFVLLLLLVFTERQRAEAAAKLDGKVLIDQRELSRLHESEKTLREVAATLGLSSEEGSDDFVTLVRTIQQALREPTARTALRDAREAIDEMNRVKEEIGEVLRGAGVASADSVAKVVRQQGHRLANQEGQIKRLEDQLVAAGQGKDARPCWVQPNGKIDYLYDVVLTSRGIRMREYRYPYREVERRDLPAPEVNPDEVLTIGSFLARTAELFEYSKRNDCRFYVVVYDATASYEKALYKDLLRAVEGHFYKRLDNGAAPF